MTTPYIKLVNLINSAAASGNVVDVSRIRADGIGARTIAIPKTGRSNKRAVAEFPLIVSDNLAAYQIAISILGPEYSQYAQQFAQQFGATVNIPNVMVSQTTVSTVPMVTVPRATVPMVTVPRATVPVAVDPQAAYVKLVTLINSASAAGKAVDVSKIANNATGARTVVYPTTARTNKRWIEGVPIISDNYSGYRKAMEILGADYLPYAERFLATYGGEKIAKIPSTPKATISQIVARSPGKYGPLIPEFPMTPNVNLITIPTVTVPKPGTRITIPKVSVNKALSPTPIVPQLGTYKPLSPPRIPTVIVPSVPQLGTYKPLSPPRIPAVPVPSVPKVGTYKPMSPPRLPTVSQNNLSPRKTGFFQVRSNWHEMNPIQKNIPSPPRQLSPPRIPTIPVVANPFPSTRIPLSPTRVPTRVPTIPVAKPLSPTRLPTIPGLGNKPLSPGRLPAIPPLYNKPLSPPKTNAPAVKVPTVARPASPRTTGGQQLSPMDFPSPSIFE